MVPSHRQRDAAITDELPVWLRMSLQAFLRLQKLKLSATWRESKVQAPMSKYAILIRGYSNNFGYRPKPAKLKVISLISSNRFYILLGKKNMCFQPETNSSSLFDIFANVLRNCSSNVP